jgi:hypothetical protein
MMIILIVIEKVMILILLMNRWMSFMVEMMMKNGGNVNI